jgi:4-diphosphocytidyl-2C-methyl-D-erythritol kinase
MTNNKLTKETKELERNQVNVLEKVIAKERKQLDEAKDNEPGNSH